MPGGQTSHSVLPSAEIGTAHRSNPVTLSPKQITLVCFAIWAVALTGITAGMLTFGVSKLDKATATQCRTHDWPVEAHQVHMDWCKANNYPTK